jgi:hypothetical protein
MTIDGEPKFSGMLHDSEGVELPPNGVNLEPLERSLVVQAQRLNQTKAAAILGLNRDRIRYRIEKFKLERSAAS